MINVIFLAFELPPLQTGGVYRPLYFSKYLKEYDIQPIIISLHRDDIPIHWPGKHLDHSLSGLLDGQIVIEVKEQFRRRTLLELLTPNGFHGAREHITWKKNLFQEVDGVIDKYKPKAIVATGPPFTILELGAQLAKKYRLPLITDMRDAWSQWNYIPFSSRVQYYITLQAERRVLSKSSAIIATSDQTITDVQKTHPKIPHGKFHLITNGYDEQVDFADKIAIQPKKKIRIGYVGSFYYSPDHRGFVLNPWWKKIIKWSLKQPYVFQFVPKKEDWLYRSPYFFFKSVNTLINQNPEFSDRLEVVFAGTKDSWFDAMVEEFKLGSVVRHIGRLSLDESHQFQKHCDYLLLTSAKVINGQDYSIAGKTFEYFTMQKPILGFTCEGAQKRILKKSGMAFILDPDQPHQNVEQLKEIFSGSHTLKPNKVFLDSLHRKALTKKLAHIIEQSIN